ncbi:Uncharacterised protein [Amycolatopsis camponoti]|uniref:Uncharacterized protein n=1 Tax=Amycolatopsis camponoti TaxID=2606593 RepID=A0A6I8LVY5_9PSEU|nr:Uncharacterised protein [Amycolatopsis camponoti]
MVSEPCPGQPATPRTPAAGSRRRHVAGDGWTRLSSRSARPRRESDSGGSRELPTASVELGNQGARAPLFKC